MTRKTSNRFAMLNHFCDETMVQVTHAESSVWLIAYRWAREVKGKPGLWEASVSTRQIARALGCHHQNVSRCILALVKNGLLVASKNGSKTWKASRYYVYPDVDPSRYAPPKQLASP